MGLDVYFYHHPHSSRKVWDDLQRLENEELYADDMTDENRDEWRRAHGYVEDPEAEHSWERWTHPHQPREVKHDHPEFPEHMFKIGYFRSSYNPGGINNFLGTYLGEAPLYAIFSEDGDVPYESTPDWGECLVRAEKCLEDVETLMGLPESSFAADEVTFIPPTLGHALKNLNRKAVLDAFMEDKRKYDENVASDDCPWAKEGQPYHYSSGRGIFYFGNPEKNGILRAVIVGTKQSIIAKMRGASEEEAIEPVAYAVFEVDPEETFGWYRDSLKIVVDTIKFFKEQEFSDEYVMHWSA